MKEKAPLSDKELQKRYQEEHRYEPDYSEGGEVDRQIEKMKKMGLDLSSKQADIIMDEEHYITIQKQYRMLFWFMVLKGWGAIALALGISFLPCIPEDKKILIIIGIAIPCISFVVIRYIISLRRRMICPICEIGKLDLLSLDHVPNERLHFHCDECNQTYISDLIYKQQLFSSGCVINIVKEKKAD